MFYFFVDSGICTMTYLGDATQINHIYLYFTVSYTQTLKKFYTILFLVYLHFGYELSCAVRYGIFHLWHHISTWKAFVFVVLIIKTCTHQSSAVPLSYIFNPWIFGLGILHLYLFQVQEEQKWYLFVMNSLEQFLKHICSVFLNEWISNLFLDSENITA